MNGGLAVDRRALLACCWEGRRREVVEHETGARGLAASFTTPGGVLVQEQGSARCALWASELVAEPAFDVEAELVLGLVEVLLCLLPVSACGCRVGPGAEGVLVVGDGVVEAVGLDAFGGLPPGASGSRLIGRLAE